MDALIDFAITFLSAHPAIGSVTLAVSGILAFAAPLLYAAQPWLQKKVEATPTKVDNIALEIFYKVIDKLTPAKAKRGSRTTPKSKADAVLDELSKEELEALLEEAGVRVEE